MSKVVDKKSPSPPIVINVGFKDLFYFANAIEIKLLYIIGAVCAMIQGILMPSMAIFFGAILAQSVDTTIPVSLANSSNIINASVNSNNNGVVVAKNDKYDSTNMVSSLFCAEKFMSDKEDLLITYSDIIYERKVLDSLIQSDSPIAISVDKDWDKLWKMRMANPLDDAETLKLRDGMYIDELGKKPKDFDDIQGQYMGLIKISADFVQQFCKTWHELDRKLTYDGQNHSNMYMTSFIQKFINIGIKVEAAFTNGGWLEIDTKSDLELYHSLYENNKLKKFINL